MFGTRKNLQKNPPAKIESMIGQDTSVRGEIRCLGSLRVDGRVEGSVNAEAVVIGEPAQVQGDISARTVVVGGKVRGNITASTCLDIKGKAQVLGDLKTAQLSIAEGAIFEGNCSMNGQEIPHIIGIEELALRERN